MTIRRAMVPSFLGLLVLGLGLVLIYVGLHGGGLLDVFPRSAYEAEPTT